MQVFMWHRKNSCSRDLISGATVSCGCYRKYNLANTTLKHGHCIVGNLSSEYRSWENMKNRCYIQENKSYKYYGGRGIKVCERWLNSFENFFADMGKKPIAKHSIERDDVNGNYEPSNCRWANQTEQNRNKRNNVWFDYDGKNMILSDWAKFFRVGSTTNILYHLRLGKTFEEVYKHFTKK